MVAMRTTVAHSMSVASGMPLAAIGAREEVPPCCATVLGAYGYACRQVALAAPARLWQGYSSLWLDSEDATYMVALATVC